MENISYLKLINIDVLITLRQHWKLSFAPTKKIYYLLITLALFSIDVNVQVSYPSVEKGLSFKSADDKVKMKLSFRIQSLASYQNNEDGSDSDMKAMVRRMRLKSSGYIYIYI